MRFREATINDIEQLHRVRTSVTENALSNPALITDKDYEEFITQRGKGWVCEVEDVIVGFAIVDLIGHNIWALFVLPAYEKRGIGSRLHQRMLAWYFAQTAETVWLSTAPGTRAAGFYLQAGWQAAGTYGKGELKFELTRSNWEKNQLPDDPYEQHNSR